MSIDRPEMQGRPDFPMKFPGSVIFISA